MIGFGIRIFSLLFALMALFPESAAAQNAVPALRANVTVTSNVVRIGDLVENAGAAADVAIFRSPDPGTRGTVPTDRIVEAIRPHQLIDIDTRGLAEVVVTRDSRAIPVQEISASIAQALAGQYGLGDAQNITVYFDRDVRSLQVEPSATGDLQVLNLSYDPRSTRFDATLDLPSSTELHRQPAHFSGTALETVAAVTVDHPIERGEVLKESDLTVQRRPKSEGGAISRIAEAVGLAARHELRPDQPLRAADLTKPDIVQRNDTDRHHLSGARHRADAARPSASRRRDRRHHRRSQFGVQAHRAGRDHGARPRHRERRDDARGRQFAGTDGALATGFRGVVRVNGSFA